MWKKTKQQHSDCKDVKKSPPASGKNHFDGHTHPENIFNILWEKSYVTRLNLITVTVTMAT